MKPTKTIGRLHFDDLSHERFEDLCVQTVYNLKPWSDLQHFGRKGKDGGVDIFGEFVDGENRKRWVVQCKRYKTISLKTLREIIDDFLEKNEELPDHYLLLLACDISRSAYEKFKLYAEQKGLTDVGVMTASILEAELYGRHPDILYTFFGIKTMGRRLAATVRIKRRILMKKKIERELTPAKPGNARDVIIHDVHRDIYPDLDTRSPGISPWFKLEYFRPYYKGSSFFMSVVTVMVEDKTGCWRIIEHGYKIPNGWTKINAYQIGNIPYDNIVEVDLDGDEYYRFPHYYCEFNNLGEPYEEIWYMPTDEFQKQVFDLPKDKQLE